MSMIIPEPAEVVAGMTGSLAGMADRQLEAFTNLLRERGVRVLHHGDAIGADEEGCYAAQALGVATEAHPCTIISKRAFTVGNVLVHEPLPPLVRNRRIVTVVPLLVATPSGPEKIRSGTWATVRYARQLPWVEIRVVWPNGYVTDGRRSFEIASAEDTCLP